MKNQGTTCHLWYCLALVLLYLGNEMAFAGGFSITEYGGRRIGTGTIIASADDLSAAGHNPAGLADLKGLRFSFFGGVILMYQNIHLAYDPTPLDQTDGNNMLVTHPTLNNPDNFDSDRPGFFNPVSAWGYGGIPSFFVSYDFGLKDWTFCAGLYVPNALGARLDPNWVSRYHAKDFYLIVAFNSYSVAGRINEYLSVGLTANIAFSMVHKNMDLGFNLFDLAFLDLDVTIDGIAWGFVLTSGAKITPFEGLNFGISISTPWELMYDASLDIDSKDTGVKYMLAVLEEEEMIPNGATISQMIPLNVNLGVQYYITSDFDISMDFRYWNYSTYREMLTITNVNGNEEYSAIDPSLNDLTAKKNFSDCYQVSAGMAVRPIPGMQELKVNALEFMTGACFDKSAAPERYYSPDSPSMDIVGWLFGARWQIDPNIRVFFGGYLYYYLTKSVRTSEAVPLSNLDQNGKCISLMAELELAY